MDGFQAALSLVAETLQALASPGVYGVAAWFLAGVFAWSGVAKLRRPSLAAIAMVDFGVVRKARKGLGVALGAAEVALALALALKVLPTFFLCVAAVLLWFFVLLIGRSLAAGERFACFCFGDDDSRLSRWTLLRTGALAVLASTLAGVLAFSPASPVVYPGASAATEVLQAISALALLGIVALGSRIPKLVSWNSDPYVIRQEVNE